MDPTKLCQSGDFRFLKRGFRFQDKKRTSFCRNGCGFGANSQQKEENDSATAV
jgi:hypothetical protein